MRMVEVLPAPLGPRNPAISPLLTEKLIPATAARWPYIFVSPATSIMTPLGGRAATLERPVTIAEVPWKTQSVPTDKRALPYRVALRLSRRRPISGRLRPRGVLEVQGRAGAEEVFPDSEATSAR